MSSLFTQNEGFPIKGPKSNFATYRHHLNYDERQSQNDGVADNKKPKESEKLVDRRITSIDKAIADHNKFVLNDVNYEIEELTLILFRAIQVKTFSGMIFQSNNILSGHLVYRPSSDHIYITIEGEKCKSKDDKDPSVKSGYLNLNIHYMEQRISFFSVFNCSVYKMQPRSTKFNIESVINQLKIEAEITLKRGFITSSHIHTPDCTVEWTYQGVKEIVFTLLGGLEDIIRQHRPSENGGPEVPEGAMTVLHQLYIIYDSLRDALVGGHDASSCLHLFEGQEEWTYQGAKEIIFTLLGGLEDIVWQYRNSKHWGPFALGVQRLCRKIYLKFPDTMNKGNPMGVAYLERIFISKLALLMYAYSCYLVY